MPPDKSWIMNRVGPGGYGITDEFWMGVKGFIELYQQYPQYMDGENIRCPCCDCKSLKFLPPDRVSYHLISRGFERGYVNWVRQGEPHWGETSTHAQSRDEHEPMVFEPIITNEPYDS
ncbi:hypothetical protein Salat_1863900 [Sesamum alatum]|uniref:Transposase-associated domain-containing protein n=1 Tax=Sesamum alatum TaxID=300844 RepID=A0AAE1Y344_9LAMI|nr:hypothetical protein Salat_1863900 [Sesamum alatum]